MNFEDIYSIVSRIPAGKVTTYGKIAMMLGRPLAARAVGIAMRNTPAIRNLPAHRVINKAGTMAPDEVFGGADIQHKLLKSEGVVFLKNGNVDMTQSLWNELT